MARAFLGPTLEFIRPLPASAIIPAALLLIGRTDAMIVSVVVFGSLWPVLLATIDGVSGVDRGLREVAALLGLRGVAYVCSIALPSALRLIIPAARVGLALALILAIVGEIVASFGGLGYVINLASRAFRAPELYVGVVLIGGLGVVANSGIERLSKTVFRAYLDDKA